ICSCGMEVRSQKYTVNHSKDCDGTEFTLHKLVVNTPSTPQCVLCETYPTTISRYTDHLYSNHRSNLRSNGIFLKCSCGLDVRSSSYNPNHSNRCDGSEFTIHKLDPLSYPQCVLCEKYPNTISGYAQHLWKYHKSSLDSNGIYLRCSCGFDVHSTKHNPDHNKKCDGRQ
ncbi:hypothetical protein PENTCL1PPCAC_12973, partial [Pristionchus entomophagus]